jgi:undecaprenyl-diphosphatase
MLTSIDYSLFQFLNQIVAWRVPIINLLISFFAVYAIVVFWGALGLWWFIGKNRAEIRQRLILAIFAFVVGRLILTELVRFFLPRSRPFETHQVYNLISQERGGSFPSGHTVTIVAVGASLYFYNKKLGLGSLILALLVGVARVTAGVHYPLDVIGALAVGIAGAWFVERFLAHDSYLSNFVSLVSAGSDRLLPFTKR